MALPCFFIGTEAICDEAVAGVEALVPGDVVPRG